MLIADFSIFHMMLAFTHMQNLLSGRFPFKFQREAWVAKKGVPERVVHETEKEAQAAVETTGSWRYQECGMSAGVKWSQPRREAFWNATSKAVGLGLPCPLELML